jgi:hypothetical protein
MTSIQLSFESLPREELSIDKSNYEVQDSIDTIKAMRQQDKSYTCRDYLSESGINIVVDQESRRLMVQWCYQTVDFFKLSRNSVHVALSCLDRFLCTPEGKPYLMNKSLYQLACITSLHMAIKVHEPFELGVSVLVELCMGVYTAEQITDTEQCLLNAIRWAVNPPSPKAFVQQFIAMLPRSVSLATRRNLLDLACYQTEMALSDYSVGALSSTSATAVASFTNALSFCPEINAASSSTFFRTLGKSTGCIRDTNTVNQIKAVMQSQMNEVDISLVATSTHTPSNCHSRAERRSSCAARSKTVQACITGRHHMLHVAVAMET